MTGNARLLMLAIASFADDDGKAWPGLKRLAEMIGVTERSTMRLVQQCEAAGELAVDRAVGRGNTNVYRILLPLKGDTAGINGDAAVTISETEKVTGVAEKVTGVAEKGDTGVTRTVIEPSIEPSERSAPVIHATLPGADIDDYDDELYEMETILRQVVKENYSYPAHAKRIREGAKALLVARHTPDEVAAHFGEGNTYWYVTSHGRKGDKPWVSNVVGEIASAVRWKADANAPDPWALIERAWKEGNGRIVLEDGRVHAAVERMGGWLRFKEAAAREIPFLKRAFMEAYNASRSP
jgi:hypothetical protein